MKLKKKIVLFVTAVSLIFTNCTSVFAARPSFSFSLSAYSSTSTWTSNAADNYNVKTIPNDDWTLILRGISFSEPIEGVGMAYALFTNTTRKSSIVWRTSSGTGHYSWDGTVGYTYNLKGRLDTDQPGRCISSGIYNADTIYD